MGNKRRKASIIIIAVIIAACSLFGAIFDVLRRFDSNSVTPVSADSVGFQRTYTGNAKRNNVEYNVEFEKDSVYMIVFAGQDGDGNNAGKGATCIGFYKAPYDNSPMEIKIGAMDSGHEAGTISSGDFRSQGHSGGAGTYVATNFALPAGTSATPKTWAGGGGGGGDEPTYLGGMLCDATFKGLKGNWEEDVKEASVKRSLPTDTDLRKEPDVDYVYHEAKYGEDENGDKVEVTPSKYTTRWKSGGPGKATAFYTIHDGYNGREPNGDGYNSYALGTPATQQNAGYSGKSGQQTPNPSILHTKERGWWDEHDYQWSGGGGGYKSGGGANADVSVTIKDKDTWGELYDSSIWPLGKCYLKVQGGGGSCSPSCYPLYSSDSFLRTKSTDNGYGYVSFYRIDPTSDQDPCGSVVTQGTPATITAGSTPGSGDGNYTPAGAVQNCGIKTKWVYGIWGKNGVEEWKENPEEITLTESGSIQVMCRYVIYAEGNTDKIGPTYNMKHADSREEADDGWKTAANDRNYIIKEKLITLKVKGVAGFYQEPEAKEEKDLRYTGKPIVLIYPGRARSGNGVVEYKFSTDPDDQWTENSEDMCAVNPDTYTIYSRVSGNGDYGPSEVKIITVTIGKGVPNLTAPTWYTDLHYDNTDQRLIDAPATVDHGTLWYQLVRDGEPLEDNWESDYRQIKAKDVTEDGDPYKVYYKVKGDDYYEDIIPESPINVHIYRGNAQLNNVGLTPCPDLKYTGSGQKLFTGAGKVIGDGVDITYSNNSPNGARIYYCITTTDTAPVPGQLGNEKLEDLKEIYAWNNGTNPAEQYTYYLWYRASKTASYNAIGWTRTNMINQISRATYNIKVTRGDNATYDAKNHKIFTNAPQIEADSDASSDFLAVTYYLDYVGNNQVIKTESDPDYKRLQERMNAGTYTFSASWGPKDGYGYGSHRNQIEIQEKIPLVENFQISKTDSPNNIVVTGLQFTSKEYNLNKNSIVYPFRKSDIVLKIDGVSQSNSIFSVSNGVDGDNPRGYNQLAYAFIKSDSAPAATDYRVPENNTANGLSIALSQLIANKTGEWSLWFKVVHHNNLADGVTFRATKIEVNGYNVQKDDLTGVAMASNITFDGNFHAIVSDTNATLKTKYDITDDRTYLGEVSYGIGTKDVAPTSWEASLAALDQQKDVGEYWLWVKWNSSNIVLANDGLCFGKFEIYQLSATTFYFSGIEFNDDGGVTTEGVYQHNFTYNGTDQRIIDNVSPLAAYKSNGDVNLAQYLGNINIGVDTSIRETSAGYKSYAPNLYEKLTVRNVGAYYVWIEWTGSDNVKAGKQVYKIHGQTLTPCFYVNKLKTDAAVELVNREFVNDTSANGSRPFSYTFDNIQKCYQPQSQKLFEAVPNTDPTFKITGSSENYNFYDYQGNYVFYMLSTSNNQSEVAAVVNNATPNEMPWKDSVEDAANAAMVGTYYLWMKVVFQDNNVSLTKYINLSESGTRITPTSSFVAAGCEPVGADGLVYSFDNENNQWEVIARPRKLVAQKSSQVFPGVEYSMDGLAWTSDIDSLTATDPGEYRIYFRGSKLSDENGKVIFETQTNCSDQFIIVLISQANRNITCLPVANNPYYTGNAITSNGTGRDVIRDENDNNFWLNMVGGDYFANGLFKPGYATFGEACYELVYSLTKNYADETPEVFYPYGDERLKLTEAGTYTLHFKPIENGNFDDDTVMKIRVQIKKAEIDMVQPFVQGSAVGVYYKGTGYQILASAGNYTLNGTNISYINYKNGDYVDPEEPGKKQYGEMGTIHYGYSRATTIQPESWVEDYRELVIQDAGVYYLWMKIDAGDNHVSLNATCLSNTKFEIKPAQLEDLDLTGTNFTVKKENGSYVRYNGLSRELLESLNLVVKVKNRDEEGGAADGYTQLGPDTGSIYYLLVSEADHNDNKLPSYKDFSASGWQNNWNTLTKVNAGKYYLYIMFAGNGNIEQGKVCLSAYNNDNQSINLGDEIRIDKANASDLSISEISGVPQTYTGADLSADDLTHGNMSLDINGFNVSEVLFDQNGNVEVKYFFWKRTDNHIEPDSDYLADDNHWLTWAEATAKNVGEYQLYVRLKILTNNIDTFTNPLIVGVLTGPYAEITPATPNLVEVINPGLNTNLVYNGKWQNLIIAGEAASLKMRNSNSIGGTIGTVSYYISSKHTYLNSEGIDFAPSYVGDGWFTNIDDVKQISAGTYYIWVKFAAGENHAAVDCCYVGEVKISQADDGFIALSGINLLQPVGYDGHNHQLIMDGSALVQKIDDYQLKETTDYISIEYGYSTKTNERPSNWVSDYRELNPYNAGKYYIWVQVVGTKNVASYCKPYNECFVEITPVTLIDDNNDLIYDYFSGVQIHDGLSYTAQEQVLANLTGDKLSIVIPIAGESDVNIVDKEPNLEIYWGLTSNNEQPEIWVNNLESLKGTNAGTYYLWIRIKGCQNVADCDAIYDAIIIAKGNLACTAELVGKNNLVYTGSEQKLLLSQPVFMLHPTGDYYGEYAFYPVYDATVEYQLGNSVYNNYLSVQAVNAGSYEITYGIAESDNWNAISRQIIVSIAKRDASDAIYGLSEAPAALSVAYNETEQDLISFGRLVDLGNKRGTALEGSQIVFWYEDDAENKYTYYYNGSEYQWDNVKGKLPGRVNAGSYVIKYHITCNDNYSQSSDFSITATIGKRLIWWMVTPQPQYGLKYTGNPQVAIVAGHLNVGDNAKGVKVKYTGIAPGVSNREWNDALPTVTNRGVSYLYYYVDVNTDGLNNNEFVGSGKDDNDATKGTMLAVSINRYVLVILTTPQPKYSMYTAENQNLIAYSTLSTDKTTSFGEQKPYFEYSFTPDDPTSWTRDNIMAVNRGEYTIYYRLHYDRNLFEFTGDAAATYDVSSNSIQIGALTASIQTRRFEIDSIRAVYNNGTLSIETDDYPAALQEEIRSRAKYEYRIYDNYNKNLSWREWHNEALTMGTYQFRVVVEPENENDKNFYAYTQSGYNIAYEQVSITGNYDVFVLMPQNTYSSVAYVRVWIDFTGSMTYEESPFKSNGWVNTNSNDPFCSFNGVASRGANQSAVLRIETINSRYYFKTVDNEYLNPNYRSGIAVNWNNESDNINQGLTDSSTTIRLFEVYRIQYDANGAALLADKVTPTEGWKWHNIDYELAENVYKRENENGELLPSNGWNTTRAGNGNNYGSKAIYRENASQIFYANFFKEEEIVYRIEWMITDGVTTYRIARNTGGWFNVADYPERETGVLIAKNNLIVLPQVIEDEAHNQFWSGSLFGNYNIRGWYVANDDWSLERDGLNNWKYFEYYLNMKATRELTFVADLVEKVAGAGTTVQCVFKDEQGHEINHTGAIASSAKAYMALSGMDATTIKNYRDGYDKWVQAIDNKKRLNQLAEDGAVAFYLGTKMVEEEKPVVNQRVHTVGDYVAMVIILLLGAGSSIASLVIYILMRKNVLHINLAKFKERI